MSSRLLGKKLSFGYTSRSGGKMIEIIFESSNFLSETFLKKVSPKKTTYWTDAYTVTVNTHRTFLWHLTFVHMVTLFLSSKREQLPPHCPPGMVPSLS